VQFAKAQKNVREIKSSILISFVSVFYASLSKETKGNTLSNITDKTVAWACVSQ